MTCPVCFKEYPNKVTKCEVCGFSDERGINPIHLTPEEGAIWQKNTVEPYREKRQGPQRNTYFSFWRRLSNNAASNEALEHFKKGELFVSRGDNDIAIEEFSDAIQKDENYAAAYMARGNIYKIYHKNDNAEQDYRKAIDIYTNMIQSDPSNTNVYMACGEASSLLVRTFCKDGKELIKKAIEMYDNAINYYQQAIRHNPDNAQAYTERGWAYIYKGEEAAAFSRSIFGSSNYYDHRNIIEKAIASCTQALKIDSNCASAYTARGRAYFYRGYTDQYRIRNTDTARNFYEKAIDDCTQALKLNSNIVEAYVTRGLANVNLTWCNSGSNPPIDDLVQALKLDPNNHEVRIYCESQILPSIFGVEGAMSHYGINLLS